MLFRKIGQPFSGMIHEYMFDEFLFFAACMKFESCSCAFMIYGLFICLSTRIEPQDVHQYILAAVSWESWVLADTWFLFLLEECLSGL